MKRIIILLAVILCYSCGKNKDKEESTGIFNMIEGVSNLNNLANEAEKIEEDNKKLINTTPISNEEIKKVLPPDLLDYNRKKYSIGNQFMPEVSMGEATYENEQGTAISLSIIDGAGETGSAMVALARLGFANEFEEETDRGYRKSTTINKYPAVEEVEIDSYDNTEHSKIDVLIANRFMVSIEGEVDVKKLKNVWNKLDLDTLENIAD